MLSEEGLVHRWHNNAFDKLAYVARYGHVPPSESARWDMNDLRSFGEAVARIVEQENRASSR